MGFSLAFVAMTIGGRRILKFLGGAGNIGNVTSTGVAGAGGSAVV
jgi:hypothetical protein